MESLVLMSTVDLSESFFQKIAGWETVKRARSLLEHGSVLSSNWSPPLLKGVVQEGSISYRAGLVIQSESDVENICRCRQSQESGSMCMHSVGVGLHHLRRNSPISTSATEARSSLGSAPGTQIRASHPPSAPARNAARLLRRAAPGEPGEEVALSVILPPNLPNAIAKGKVMVCFEANWRQGRQPLNALPKTTALRFSEGDALLLDLVEELAGNDTPGMLLLEIGQFAKLLSRLVDHPGVSIGRSKEAIVSSIPWRVQIRAMLESSGEIEMHLQNRSADVSFIQGTPGWAWQGGTFQPSNLPPSIQDVLSGPIRISRSQVPVFLSRDWPLLEANCDLQTNFRLTDFTLEPQAPRFILALAGGLAQLRAQLQCAYGPRIMTLGVTAKDEALWLPDPASPTRYGTRNLAAEQRALAELLRAGFTGPDVQGQYLLAGQNQVLNFFARIYPRLQKEWDVTLEERLERSTSQNIEWVQPRFQITPSGEQWFDLDVAFSSQSGERFSPADIQRLVLSGQSHTRLRNGRFALVDTGAVEELQEVLLDCAPQQHAQGYRLRNAQAGFLDATLNQQQGWTVQAPSEWRQRAARQMGKAQLETPPLGELEPVLRPYQKEGVAWLWFLRENEFGGILADEMGLGKTLQALACLQASLDQRKKAMESNEPPAPALVVCPTSLVYNWEAEARKFLPALKTLVIHGPQRGRLFAGIPEAGLVITSYALVRRDAERYKGFEFDTIILDEAQHIKNRQTQNAQAVKAVRARHRFVLTGTPLENSVLDLWSIFDFLMPGYLGTATDFRERYELPITRDQSAEAQNRLARRVRPFLLRRLKADVAKDLPEKIEQVAFCEMTDDQKAAYQQVLEFSRKEVLDAVGAQGLEKSRLIVLNALLRLRQICCDLRLLQLENVNPDTASGKLDLFGELLQEVLDGGHRVLVFSQFVRMLTLLREKLAAEQIAYCYLDGSTTNRIQVVDQFQQSPEIPVFLISLKAGGLGLNLTAADTVIHFDPWWNPAVEAQATDRAHRIGQTRVVTSYKLITRGSVEEKILNLQSRKRELFKGVLSGEEELSKALGWDEIQQLLA
jgi:superfamily II DNA or RNA helicase